jgi:hypothetical protein
VRKFKREGDPTKYRQEKRIPDMEGDEGESPVLGNDHRKKKGKRCSCDVLPRLPRCKDGSNKKLCLRRLKPEASEGKPQNFE